jgi:hypothetical protein
MGIEHRVPDPPPGSSVDDRLSRLVVIEEPSFSMDVEPPLLDLCMNHNQSQGHKRLQTV